MIDGKCEHHGLCCKSLTKSIFLQAEGFSEAMIDRFFRPFLGGIFFNKELTVTSRLFAFVMRMLATGSNCLPAAGIGAVSQQIAAALPSSAVQLNRRAESVTAASASAPAAVATAAGSVQAARGVIVAVEGPEAQRLLSDAGDAAQRAKLNSAGGVGTCNLYFSVDASAAPPHGNVLYLDGEQRGVVNNACVPSSVSASYAPAGKALISASTIGVHKDKSDEELETVRRQRSASCPRHSLAWHVPVPGAYTGTGIMQYMTSTFD